MDLPSPLLSPSKAARVASLSRAWTHTTAFLTPLFYPSPIPPFEHNPATLTALLALASHAESQTEQETLLAATRACALKELQDSLAHDPNTPLFAAIEEDLTDEGRQALEGLASLSTALGGLSADPEAMAHSLLQLTRSEFDTQQQLRRIETLQAQLKAETASAQTLLSELRSPQYQTPPDLVRKTGEWTRGSKQLDLKLREYKERITRLERSTGGKPEVGIPQIRERESEVRELGGRVLGLEEKVRTFGGLPPDRELALLEVERARAELEGLVRTRDGLFEGLVEGEKGGMNMKN